MGLHFNRQAIVMEVLMNDLLGDRIHVSLCLWGKKVA